ncbi:MAG: hypothetical protein GTO55_01020 [Armatimonadetes bacterium]|nr:hypothetical protein [Armatimonadota bacterium]NIM22865.1 hypothetical protein [Armatimonadota bacterium]NIM66731.1 hypothetical protein [Armatimonadota bacterium]NIM75288.1 hypothetical protein [Armatimonadota bacterium]NIN04928.1 hypothetical protein [Armatimonadota bacterium]
MDSPQDKVKLSLRLPAGWEQDGPVENGMAFFKDKENVDNNGTVCIWPADGKALNDWVDSQVRYMGKMEEVAGALGEEMEQFGGVGAGDIPEEAFGWRLISRTPKTVGKWEAAEMVEELSGKKSITYFVKKGDRICQVSFFAFPEDWAENESLFRKSLESVKIR